METKPDPEYSDGGIIKALESEFNRPSGETALNDTLATDRIRRLADRIEYYARTNKAFAEKNTYWQARIAYLRHGDFPNPGIDRNALMFKKILLECMEMLKKAMSAESEMCCIDERPRKSGVQIGFKKIHPNAVLPKYAHEGDAGMDVCAVEDVTLKPFTATLVHTGLQVEIPKGYEIQVRPRSGLALKESITVLNSPGTIDEGYKGEIGVILYWAPSLTSAINTDACSYLYHNSDCRHTIHKGDRIAQLVVAPVTRCEPIEIADVSTTERGLGGFGSTGV